MLLTAHNIVKSFGNLQDNTLRTVLNGVDFQLEEGKSAAILGPSGSGKTTLLNILGTLDQADSGKVTFKGRDISGLSGKETDHFRNREIGFIFQFHHLLPQCTLLENVLMPTLVMKNREMRKKKMEEAEILLRRVGIWDHRDKLPSKLSGGECQRVAVVRAMINQPSLLLADEPTGALDRENAEIIASLLTGLNRNDGLSLLVVTHSQSLAEKMEDIYGILDGKLVRQDKENFLKKRK
jgi:ABC-type lipoprotein export system ATPase subunit